MGLEFIIYVLIGFLNSYSLHTMNLLGLIFRTSAKAWINLLFIKI